MLHRWIIMFFVVLSASAHAQWLNFPTPGTPLTAAGKPDMSAPTPRTADGRPDLSGTWMHELTSVAEVRRLFGPAIDERIKLDVPGMEIGTQHKYAFNIFIDLKPEDVSMRPAAEDILRRRVAAGYVPGDVCTEVPGFPVAGFLSVPIKIVQAPRQTIVLYEAGSLHRQIYSDGRSFPKVFELPAFLGYSVGHWEGDVFIVVTAGFNNKTSLDRMGHPHSEALRVTERFRRTDFGHMDIEMTFDDSEMYTKPFTIKVPHELLGDADIFESFCENEKDRVHIQNAAAGSGAGAANGGESKPVP
jgi:hypothetical protein